MQPAVPAYEGDGDSDGDIEFSRSEGASEIESVVPMGERPQYPDERSVSS